MANEDFDPTTESPETPDVNSDGADPAVVALRHERDELKDRLLRQAAEFDNYRKRVERERRAHGDESVTRLLLELLLVIDDFDRALTVDTHEGSTSFRKGLELIHGKLHELLRKQNVKPLETIGVQFDPNLHEAVIHEPSPNHREGEVIAELRKGYTQGERLLRPAMVKVAQA
ncbi:MAG: nucleotide exchange factor GrpE [Vicinamibacterales bacterium]